ncbi:MAG: hypothetical protein ABW202_06240 [Duganella sp.]
MRARERDVLCWIKGEIVVPDKDFTFSSGHRNVSRSARDILNRLNEISFNSPLLKELRMIALLRQSMAPEAGSDESDLETYRWAKMRIHRLTSDRMAELGSHLARQRRFRR